MTGTRLPSDPAVDRTDPLERPPETVSELAGAEAALPYLREGADVAGFARLTDAAAARARVSPPLLPLLAAALWTAREQAEPRGLVIVVDDDEAAHALADGAAPFLPGRPVAYLPSRGADYGSGLEPAAHLVGERSRALDVLARGGLVAVSADALVERVSPPGQRPRPSCSSGVRVRGSTGSSSSWRPPATPARTPSRSAARSRCAAD
jgi:hypothetical protein